MRPAPNLRHTSAQMLGCTPVPLFPCSPFPTWAPTVTSVLSKLAGRKVAAGTRCCFDPKPQFQDSAIMAKQATVTLSHVATASSPIHPRHWARRWAALFLSSTWASASRSPSPLPGGGTLVLPSRPARIGRSTSSSAGVCIPLPATLPSRNLQACTLPQWWSHGRLKSRIGSLRGPFQLGSAGAYSPWPEMRV